MRIDLFAYISLENSNDINGNNATNKIQSAPLPEYSWQLLLGILPEIGALIPEEIIGILRAQMIVAPQLRFLSSLCC